MDKKSIVVIGAGPGLGNAIGKRFGKGGYNVALVARSEDKLAGYQEELADLGIEASVYAADASDFDAFAKTIEDIRSEKGDPDVVVYNVGITTPDEDPLTPEDLMRHFAADVAGAYAAIEGFSTKGFAEKKGAIILTGGGFADYPFPGYVALSLDKAALRNLAQEKNQELADSGIFVGTVTVCDTIGGSEHFSPDNIADCFWELNQTRDSFEVKYQ